MTTAEAVVNNVRLHYREAGRGRPLLLLHGLASSGGVWEQPEVFTRLLVGFLAG